MKMNTNESQQLNNKRKVKGIRMAYFKECVPELLKRQWTWGQKQKGKLGIFYFDGRNVENFLINNPRFCLIITYLRQSIRWRPMIGKISVCNKKENNHYTSCYYIPRMPPWKRPFFGSHHDHNLESFLTPHGHACMHLLSSCNLKTQHFWVIIFNTDLTSHCFCEEKRHLEKLLYVQVWHLENMHGSLLTST